MENRDTQENRFIDNVCSNTKSDLIEITEDKLANILTSFIQKIKKLQIWVAPLSLFVSILLVMCTAEFNKNTLSISKDVWAAIFYLLLIFSFIWLVYSLIYIVSYRKKTNLKCIIKEIKNN